MADIYQQIWDADQDTNGIPAIRSGAQKPATGGFVVVDENVNEDSAGHRVLTEVEIPESKRETYELCTRLFDNYFLDPALQERITEGEVREVSDFVEAIAPTPPLQVARGFIASQLNRDVTEGELKTMILETWFLQGRAGSKTASGFEHVFVGEQKDKGAQQPQERKLGGYHFWYKYFLDDAGDPPGDAGADVDRIVYRGVEYGGGQKDAHGVMIPEVVTLEFRWTAPDFREGGNRLLKKPIGGFWVGPSPEGMIALGLVRARGGAAQAEINGVQYGVDFHALDNNRRSIRTFFPRFQKCVFCSATPPDGQPPQPVAPDPVTPEPPPAAPAPSPAAADSVRIVAALVNPAGNETSRETVTLINVTPDQIDLAGWTLTAPNGWTFEFSDHELQAGEVRTFRMLSGSPQFRNRGGTITLRDSTQSIQHRVEYTTEEGRKEGFTVLF